MCQVEAEVMIGSQVLRLLATVRERRDVMRKKNFVVWGTQETKREGTQR